MVRASNGVIMVTTKKGVAGAAKVSFEAYYGISQASNTYDAMNSRQYMEFVNDARNRAGGHAGLYRYSRGVKSGWAMVLIGRMNYLAQGLIKNITCQYPGGLKR